MPDIMLLPIIADTLGVTIDELFGIKHKVQEKPINCEESIHQHSGFVSAVSGAVYANKDIALAYLPIFHSHI